MAQDFLFTENGPTDVVQLNALYRTIGWDRHERRTEGETEEMLRVSRYYVTAQTSQGRLVGFARVCGDPYIVQLLDVITHPDYRRRGIAARCMEGVMEHVRSAAYVAVTCTAVRDLEGFYERLGFRRLAEATLSWRCQ